MVLLSHYSVEVTKWKILKRMLLMNLEIKKS